MQDIVHLIDNQRGDIFTCPEAFHDAVTYLRKALTILASSAYGRQRTPFPQFSLETCNILDLVELNAKQPQTIASRLTSCGRSEVLEERT